MAETLISPGVLARENDQSQVTQGPVTAGAAIIGPTVKGPVGIPTLVTSYSDYTTRFGSSFISGGASYSYLTSIAVYNYFTNGGQSMLVTRVVTGSFTPATSTTVTNQVPSTAGAFAVGSATLVASIDPFSQFRLTYGTSTYDFFATGSGGFPAPDDVDGGVYYFASASSVNNSATNLAAKITAALPTIVSVTANAGVLAISGSTSGSQFNGVTFATGSGGVVTTLTTLAGGIDGVGSNAFVLETLAPGVAQNSSGSELSNGILQSGSADNVRWQIVAPNTASGTFTLLVRRGDDTTTTPTILETWSNLSLDPLSPNYIEAVIGNQAYTVQTDSSTGTTYIQQSGTYTNKSRYIRVKSVTYPTPNYLNNNGAINSGSDGTSFGKYLPTAASGTMTGATGVNYYGSPAMYDTTTTSTNIQGIPASAYTQTINLLSNTDDYKFNSITVPGLTTANAPSQLSSLVNMCANRGDAIAVIDVAAYGATVGTVTNNASAYNNSYAATYWPWLQTIDPDTGKQVFVPASTMIPGVYAYNDSVSEPWFAPAGINRGGLSTVIQAERRLSQTDRDTLYVANVNPIATFPGTGVVVYGQKTLQKAASALDRVNVRRLLIALKSYISQVANNLVFEQNSIATRNNFLAQVNPYLQSVQQRQGLYAFKVVMDDSNNTPDVIDRNQLVGQIYLQPTKTAEFILLDFNVLPTGATFG